MGKKNTHHTVPFRRKRLGRTDYKKRIAILKSRQPRVFFKLGSRDAVAQVILFNPNGDETKVSLRASSLKPKGWFFSNPNIPTCYLFGYCFGKKCLELGIKEGIFDTGIIKPKRAGRHFAFAKGVVDAGFSMPVDPAVFPSDERISGQHIANFASALKKNGELSKRFSFFVNNKKDPEEFVNDFKAFLNKIKKD